MKNVRAASIYLHPDNPVYVKQGNNYYVIKCVWPDTNAAPMGRALYLEIEETPAHIVNSIVKVTHGDYHEVSTLSH